MKKKIDFTRWALKKDLGFRILYIQDGIEYDENGVSIKDFPDKAQRLSDIKSDEKILLSKNRQLFKTEAAAKEAARRKKIELDKCEYIHLDGGVAIRYEYAKDYKARRR